MRKFVTAAAVAAQMGVGAMAVASSASAYVVCNAAGECWHTDRRAQYGPNVVLQYHPDDWYFHQDWAHDNHRQWREYHEGRGYYNNGAWMQR